MSKFKKYLFLESIMPLDLALSIFGLAVEDIDEKTIKDRYKKLAIENHPDHGGDAEIMKQINNAYEILKRKKKIQSREKEQDDFDQRIYSTATGLKNMLMSGFKPELFLVHFKNIFGKEFEYSIKRMWPDDKKDKPKYYLSGAGFDVEFSTVSRNTIFTLSIHASRDSIYKSMDKTTLGAGMLSFEVYIEAHGFFGNKKQKLTKRDWNFTNDHSFLNDPDKIFPKAKLQKIVSGKTNKRAFKKRDMIAYITQKLKGAWDGEYAKIYLDKNKEFYLLMYRMTFRRLPIWGANGIYKKYSRIAQGATISFPETEEVAQFFGKMQKATVNITDEVKLTAKVNKMLRQKYDKIMKDRE